jgi:hypothetical protein
VANAGEHFGSPVFASVRQRSPYYCHSSKFFFAFFTFLEYHFRLLNY